MLIQTTTSLPAVNPAGERPRGRFLPRINGLLFAADSMESHRLDSGRVGRTPGGRSTADMDAVPDRPRHAAQTPASRRSDTSLLNRDFALVKSVVCLAPSRSRGSPRRTRSGWAPPDIHWRSLCDVAVIRSHTSMLGVIRRSKPRPVCADHRRQLAGLRSVSRCGSPARGATETTLSFLAGLCSAAG